MRRKEKYYKAHWLICYLVILLTLSLATACGVLMKPARRGWVEKSTRNFKFVPEGGRRVRRISAGRFNARFLTGRPFKMVFTTIIRHKFSGGPWTSDVQGPKFLNARFLANNFQLDHDFMGKSGNGGMVELGRQEKRP